MGRRLLFALAFALLATAGGASIIDRIAATVDRDVITLSEVQQVIALRLVPGQKGESDTEYARRVLDTLITQALRYRDVQRFGAEDVSNDTIESRFVEVQRRFSSPAEFQAALARTEMSADEVRALIKRQLQVEAYVEERFSPLIFVSLEDIENYYNSAWAAQRRERGLPQVPLSEAQDEIRTLLKSSRLTDEVEKWTSQLRARANVDVYVYR